MSIHFNQNNTVKKVKSIYANVEGTVKKIKSVWVDDNGTPKRVYSSAPESVLVLSPRMVWSNNFWSGGGYVYFTENCQTFTQIPVNDLTGGSTSWSNARQLISEISYYLGYFFCLVIKFNRPSGGGTAQSITFYIRRSENLEDWEDFYEIQTSFTSSNPLEGNMNTKELFFGIFGDKLVGKVPLDNNGGYKTFYVEKSSQGWSVVYSAEANIEVGPPNHYDTSTGVLDGYKNVLNSSKFKSPTLFNNKYVMLKDDVYNANTNGFYVNDGTNPIDGYSAVSTDSKRGTPMPFGVLNINGTEILILAWDGGSNNVVLSYTLSTSISGITPLTYSGNNIVLFEDGEYASGASVRKINKAIHYFNVKEVRGRYFISFVIKYTGSGSTTVYEGYVYEVSFSSNTLSVIGLRSSQNVYDIVEYDGEVYATVDNRFKRITNFDSTASSGTFTFADVSNSPTNVNLGNIVKKGS